MFFIRLWICIHLTQIATQAQTRIVSPTQTRMALDQSYLTRNTSAGYWKQALTWIIDAEACSTPASINSNRKLVYTHAPRPARIDASCAHGCCGPSRGCRASRRAGPTTPTTTPRPSPTARLRSRRPHAHPRHCRRQSRREGGGQCGGERVSGQGGCRDRAGGDGAGRRAPALLREAHLLVCVRACARACVLMCVLMCVAQ